MTETYELTVYLRHGQLFVSPSVMSEIGLQSLGTVIRVARPDDLVAALEAGATRAREAQQRSPNQRFPPGRPFWEAAGASSWKDFVAGTRAVAILHLPESIQLELQVPDARLSMLEDTGMTRDYSADAPPGEVACAVLEMLGIAPNHPRFAPWLPDPGVS